MKNLLVTIEKSAHDINLCIARYFDESQIYRIDHYLTKEVVGNIALVRFTNCVFEPLWKIVTSIVYNII